MGKQTATEWLEQELKTTFEKEGKLPLAYTLHLVHQAQIAEYKQIAEAWNDGNLLGKNGHVILEYNTGDEYFIKEYR